MQCFRKSLLPSQRWRDFHVKYVGKISCSLREKKLSFKGVSIDLRCSNRGLITDAAYRWFFFTKGKACIRLVNRIR